jgi:long-chain acyl-CoA synthetase
VGAVAVPLNAWWRGEELAYGLRDSGTKVLIADEERRRRVSERRAELPLQAVIVTRAAAGSLPGDCQAWEEIVAGPADDVGLPDVSLEPEEDATIFYTSGTTGFPKGALGTHRNICSNLMTLEFLRARSELRTGVAPPPDLQLASLLSVPFFHVTGCHSTLVPALALGSKLVLMYKFDAHQALRLIERERVTSFGGVPTLVWKVLECDALERTDTSSVLRVGYGGAAAAPELVRRIKETFPAASPSNGYGLTETSSVTSTNAGEDYVLKPDSVGPPVPVCEVKVVDPSGAEVSAGEVGELWIRGANVIRGYWNKPEATAETFTDGWLHSGDLARLDGDGFIYIVDRAKDMVIRGGENIYSVEVEAVLFDHPQVIDAAVFGVPHRVLGEEVAAVVQVRPGHAASVEEIRAHAAERLAAYKVPAHVAIRLDELPRNANGKTMKSELRRELLAEMGRSSAGDAATRGAASRSRYDRPQDAGSRLGP